MQNLNNAIIGIYKITSPSGKIYIGQSINIHKRWSAYKNIKYVKQPRISNSVLKYGIENHRFEIIEECLLEELDKQETYWKQYYINKLGWDKMLFCQLIDGKGGPKSKETKLKISLIKKGSKLSQDICIKMSKSKLGIFKHTQKTKENIGLKNSKPKPKNFGSKIKVINSKPILQYDLQGNFIKEWPSMTEINKNLKISIGFISGCCNGKYNKAKGYVWKFKV